MTTLSSQLDAMRATVSTMAPAAALEAIDADAQRLQQSGLAQRALGAGQRAPDFVLPDATGKLVDIKALRARGPLVVSFYRGSWCPYCNIELQAWQQELAALQAMGATLIAISPQTPDASLTTAQKHALAYPVLSDVGNHVARQFGLVFTLHESLRPIYAAFGIDLPAHNGESSFELPVPATYVIDRDGTIAGAWVDVDYRNRAEPASVMATLREVAATA
jgi:peroxiredoxin